MLIAGFRRCSDCYINLNCHKDGASESDRVSSHHGGGRENRTTGD